MRLVHHHLLVSKERSENRTPSSKHAFGSASVAFFRKRTKFSIYASEYALRPDGKARLSERWGPHVSSVAAIAQCPQRGARGTLCQSSHHMGAIGNPLVMCFLLSWITVCYVGQSVEQYTEGVVSLQQNLLDGVIIAASRKPTSADSELQDHAP